MASSLDLNPEPLRVRWGRRALTVSGVFALSAFVAATFPLLAVVALLLDLYRRHAWLSLRCLLFFCGYLFYYCAGILGCFGAWMLSGGSDARCARLTQRQLAKKLRLSVASVRAYEVGTREPVGDNLRRVEKFIAEKRR